MTKPYTRLRFELVSLEFWRCPTNADSTIQSSARSFVASQTWRRMYLVDSPRREIYEFDYELATGNIENRTCIFQAPSEIGYPDGMAIDTDDQWWVAFWGGWCVAKICPKTSQILAKVPVPVAAPTACAFGGHDHDRLLITTASIGLSEKERLQQPLAGDLFIADVQARGFPQPEYAG